MSNDQADRHARTITNGIPRRLHDPGSKARSHPKFPGAIANVSPAPGYAKASIRFAIWIFYAALRDMMTMSLGKRTRKSGYRGKPKVERDELLTCPGMMLRLAPTNQQELGVFRAIEDAITSDVTAVFNCSINPVHQHAGRFDIAARVPAGAAAEGS